MNLVWRQAHGRLSAILGSVSGGLGTFGTWHNVCHYTCQALVTGLGVVGIAVTGLPLTFLEDPRLIALFGGVGVVSLAGNLAFRVRARRSEYPARAVRWWRLLDLRGGVALVFLLASVWSVAHAATRLVGSAGAQEASTQTRKEGGVELKLTLLNLEDASIRDALVFAIAMNSMDMSAQSFATYDLKRAIALEIDGAPPLHPSDVHVSELGHMGHHLRGQLTFAVAVETARGRPLRVSIKEIGGIQRLVLEWRLPRAQ